MSSTPAFIYSEAKIADALGISRTQLRSYRSHLSEGDDWKKERGEILLSNKGVGRLSQLCGQPCAADSRVFLESLAAKKNGGPKKARVAQICANQKMVLALEEGNPSYYLVHVGNNATFVLDDEIEIGPHTQQQGIWQLLSPVPRDRRRLPGQ